MIIRHQNGLTLIEILVTLTIAGILLGIGMPSFSRMMERNRVVTYTNGFIGSLNYARSESIRRGVTVSVCPSSTGTSCGTSWNAGWIVFANLDGDFPAAVDVGESVLAAHDGLADSYSLDSATFTDTVSFGPNGSTGMVGTFAVCYKNSTTDARAIVITQSRPRVGKDTDGNNIPNTDFGDIADCSP
jgi:type IV fimbrial biogenesis protein FimT